MFEIRFFTTFESCSNKIDSSFPTCPELYCFLVCEHYHMLYIMIGRLLHTGNVHISEMFFFTKEWNNFFDFMFQTKFCMYNYRRYDIGLEIASLCVLRNLSIENSFVINNT